MTDRSRRIERVRRPPAAARDWYDTLSPWYGRIADPFERGSRSAGLDLLDPSVGERIVDLGCGPGGALVPLASAVGEEGLAVGVDVAAGMCREARAALERAGLSPRAAVVCGDARDLPLGAGTLDAVFMSFTLELFDTPDLPAVLAECARALRSDGRVAVVSLSKRGAGLLTALYERVHRAVPRYVDCRPIYLRETLRDAGFDVIDARHRTVWGLPVEAVLARP